MAGQRESEAQRDYIRDTDFRRNPSGIVNTIRGVLGLKKFLGWDDLNRYWDMYENDRRYKGKWSNRPFQDYLQTEGRVDRDLLQLFIDWKVNGKWPPGTTGK